MRRSAVIGTDDDQLIALAAGGDRQSFGELYERYALRVFRHAQFLTGDPVLAEPLEVKHSHVLVPATPGTGIRWDEKAVKKYAA